jgi:hypothetical protein
MRGPTTLVIRHNKQQRLKSGDFDSEIEEL